VLEADLACEAFGEALFDGVAVAAADPDGRTDADAEADA
jgi:hypothetical protein